MIQAVLTVVLLVAGGGATPRIGAAFAEATGRLVLVLDSRAAARLDEGIQQLRAAGVEVVVEDREPANAYLIDEHGILRRRNKIPSTAAGLVEFVTQWEGGRTVFKNRCARCHGDDGMDDSYPLIPKLGGMGARYTRDEIRSKLHPGFAGRDEILVRGETFTKAEFEDLLTFLAGL